MWKIRFINVIVIFCIFLNTGIQGTKQRFLIVDRVDLCYIPKDAPYKLHYVHLKYSNTSRHDCYVSASAEVLELLEESDVSGDLDIERCASKEAPDTCEKLHTFRPMGNICNFIEMEGIGFKQLMDTFTPPLRCPFKGNYSTNNARWNSQNFALFPIDNYYWKIKAHGYWKNRVIGTLCIEAAVKSL